MAGVALAAPGGRRKVGEADRASRVAAWQQELGLNDDQVGQIQKLRADARRRAIRQRADLQLARLNLREAIQASPVDEKLVQARTKELSDLRSANLRARVETGLAVRRILTPEQQEKAKELRGARRVRRHERRSENDGQERPLTRPEPR